jgi:hypothetical protein
MKPQYLAVAALLLAGTACRDPVQPGAAVAGVYQLITVNTEPLPAVLHADSVQRWQVLEGQLHLQANGDWLEQVRISQEVLATNSYIVHILHENGTFTLRGDSIIFRLGNHTYSGTHAEQRIVYVDRGLQMEWVR